MKALVLYESLFGDGRDVAHAIGQGLSTILGESDVSVVEIGQAPSEIAADLLVVGSPTHAFGLPSERSRQDAEKQHGVAATSSVGVREWLQSATLSPGQKAVAYDTRMDHPKLLTTMDHASHQTEKGLKKLGAKLIAPADKFHVVDVKGPLAPGELSRAQAWGAELAALLEKSN